MNRFKEDDITFAKEGFFIMSPSVINAYKCPDCGQSRKEGPTGCLYHNYSAFCVKYECGKTFFLYWYNGTYTIEKEGKCRAIKKN